jgi:hypothetical protein
MGSSVEKESWTEGMIIALSCPLTHRVNHSGGVAK